MIRKFRKSDADQVMEIWLKSNEDAHPFIPKAYWLSNFYTVREEILKSDIFIYESKDKLHGFIGITGEYIAGIFVEGAFRGQGIGTALLKHVKEIYGRLSLRVYHKNPKAYALYLREGFRVFSEETDSGTGEREYLMIWEK